MSEHLDGASLAEQALRSSTSDDCHVIVERTGSINLRWARNSLTTNGLAHDTTVTVIAFDHRADGIAVASVSATVHDADGVRALAVRADAAARLATLAEDAADLPRPRLDADFDTPATAVAPDRLSAPAAAVGDLVGWAAGTGIETFGYAELVESTTWFAASGGARLRHVQPSGRLEITAKSHERTRSTWVGLPSVDLTTAEWTDVQGQLARALQRQATVVPWQPGRYPTVLPSSAVADLMVDLHWSSLARDAHEGRTAFHDEATRTGTRLGQQVAAAGVTLRSDPDDALAPCQPFALVRTSGRGGSVFDNGRELSATDWIADGRLAHLVATSADARRIGVPAAPGIDTLHALLGTASAATIDELVAGVDEGLLLTCVWYVRSVDPRTMLLTGLTRDGVYAIRGGEIAGAVTNFRFNDSPLSMLSRVRAATPSVRTLGREMADYANRTVMPAVVVDGLNMTSVSDAR